MAEVIFPGPSGRLQGCYHHGPSPDSPVAIILHPDPRFGGTMNHPVVYYIHRLYVGLGFSVLRFNFRGVGLSEGKFDHGQGELSDAAAAMDWTQKCNPEARDYWVVGFSFGAWIAMQLLMRRPEVGSFVSIAPLVNHYDFSFLAPCPSSGIIIHGGCDRVVPYQGVKELVDKLRLQKDRPIAHHVVEGADHFFTNNMPTLVEEVRGYLHRSLFPDEDLIAETMRAVA